jgi:uncharacterized membrane protein
MKRTKSILIGYPEYYLMALVLIAGYSTPFYFNPVSIGIAVLLMLQIVFKNKLSGLLIASIYLLINLYLLGALISEFLEFPLFDHSAKQLLFVGLSIWCLNIFTAAVMMYKYIKFNNKDLSAI